MTLRRAKRLSLPSTKVQGSSGRVGARYHVVNRGLVLVPFLSVAPVFVGDLPALVRSHLPCLEAPQLLVLVYVNQYLATTAPWSVSCASKSLISPYARCQAASSAKPSTRSTSTRPYQLRSKSPSGRRAAGTPKAPEVVLSVLLFRGSGNLDDLIDTGVEGGSQALDDPALACGIGSFENQDGRDAFAARLAESSDRAGLGIARAGLGTPSWAPAVPCLTESTRWARTASLIRRVWDGSSFRLDAGGWRRARRGPPPTRSEGRCRRRAANERR